MSVINVPGVRDYATKGATDEIQSGITSVKADTATNNTASKTGTLSQKESYAIGLLENGTYGLNAINAKIGAATGKMQYAHCGRCSLNYKPYPFPSGFESGSNMGTMAVVSVGECIYICTFVLSKI